MLELSLDDLRERWDYLLFQLGIEELLITEESENGTNKIFIVSGLSMEVENEYAFCTDFNDDIVNNLSRLMIFLRNNLTKILLYPYKDWYQERLEFNDGCCILIEKA